MRSATCGPDLQVKLLRVLEGRGFERVGGNRKIPLEARIVAATNVDLQEAMRLGQFRDDLYYRLFTVPIHLPPLREKREDIPILVKYFLEQLNRKFNKKIRGVDPKVMRLFCRHPWPGNVREMQHVLEYCFVFAKGPFITERHLPRLESAWAGRELEDLDSSSALYRPWSGNHYQGPGAGLWQQARGGAPAANQPQQAVEKNAGL